MIDMMAALTGGMAVCLTASKVAIESGGFFYVLVAAIAVLGINAGSGFYDRACSRSLLQITARAAFSTFLAASLVCLVLWIMSHVAYGGEMIAVPTLALFAGVFAYRGGEPRVPSLPSLGYRVLVFGAGQRAMSVHAAAEASSSMVNVVGFYPSSKEDRLGESCGRLLPTEKSLIQTALELRVDEIVVAVNDRRGGSLPLQELLQCRVMGIRVNDLSTHFEKMLGQIRIDSLQAGWLIFGDGFEQGLLRRTCKRLFDIVFASTLLVLTTPIMLLTAAMIVIESGFPILYRQERMGRDGTRFKVTKFRSMRTDAEKDGKPKWAAGNDDRATKVGRFIRKYRIDELPQLFNVLNGEMSLVGPRPERPFFVEQLTGELPFYGLRHSVKPGLTGWAQVSYGYGASVEDACQKLQYDLFYVKNNTLFLDFLILFKTVGVVLNGHGAR
jgi:sugar transferase (PEP-CTERM system associated)